MPKVTYKGSSAISANYDPAGSNLPWYPGQSRTIEMPLYQIYVDLANLNPDWEANELIKDCPEDSSSFVRAFSDPVTGGIEIPMLVPAGVVRGYSADADLVLHPSPPTLTFLGAGVAAPFSVDKFYPYNNLNAVNLLGFLPRYVNQWGSDYYENGINDTWTPSRYAVEFDVFGQDLCLLYRARTANPYFWIWVDGKPCAAVDATPSGIAPSPGSLHRVRLQFSTAGARRVRVYCELADYGGIEVPSGTMVVATASQNERLAIVGDSWAEGTSYTTPFASLSSVIGRRSGVVPFIAAQGGTGYTVNGGGGNKSAYGSSGRVAAVAAVKPTSILFVGTINDRSAQPATLQASVISTVNAYKAVCPNAKVFIAGVECTSYSVSAGDLSINAAISAAASQLGVPFIDMLTAPFVERSGLMSAMIGADGSHPTTLGAAMVADRISSWLIPQLPYRR